MRVTELKGRQVVDPTTAAKRGRVVDVLVDPTTKYLAGLTIAADGEESHHEISARHIARIGSAAVMLRREIEGDVGDTNLRHEDYLDYASLVGLEVLDEGGDLVGRLQDAKLDPDRLAITGYTLIGTGWRAWLGSLGDITPSQVSSWSRELMLVQPRTGAASSFAAPATGSIPTGQSQSSDREGSDEPHSPTTDDGEPASDDVAAGSSGTHGARMHSRGHVGDRHQIEHQ